MPLTRLAPATLLFERESNRWAVNTDKRDGDNEEDGEKNANNDSGPDIHVLNGIVGELTRRKNVVGQTRSDMRFAGLLSHRFARNVVRRICRAVAER